LTKTAQEITELINAIEDCGYIWDESDLAFYNPDINKAIGTDGLVEFNPERFKRFHQSVIKKHPPDQSEFNRITRRVISHNRSKSRLIWKLSLIGLTVLIFLMMFGWVFMPLEHWLILVGVFLILVLMWLKSKRVP
jgi:hypothetical protein